MELKMKGYRTTLAILLSLLGGVGVFERLGVTQDEVAQFIDILFTAVFGLTALYLNRKNHLEMKEAGLRDQEVVL